MDPKEIESNIKKYYSMVGADWRSNKTSDGARAAFHSRLTNKLRKKQLKVVLNLLKNRKGTKILDAACGHGTYSLALARKYNQSKIYAVDFVKSMCEVTQKKTKNAGLRNIIVRKEDIDNLSFKNGFFDIVLCIDTLHHTPNSGINKKLKELSRVTKKGGLLVVDFKNKKNPLIRYQYRKRNRITYYRTTRTFKEMEKSLNKVGVRILKKESVGFPFRFPAFYVTILCEKE